MVAFFKLLLKQGLMGPPIRILIDETSSIRLVIPHQVVMQPCLFIEVLVLQSERLMRVLINPLVLFQTTPSGVFAVPQQIAVDVGHLFWNTDLVAVEVVGLLSAFAVFVGPVMYLCQGFVCTSHALRQDWKFHAGYGLLILVRFLIFCYIRNSDIFIIKHIIPNVLIKFFCGHLLRYFKGCVGTRKLIM